MFQVQWLIATLISFEAELRVAKFMEIWYITVIIKHCTVFLYSQNVWESLVLTSPSPIPLVGDAELPSSDFFLFRQK